MSPRKKLTSGGAPSTIVPLKASASEQNIKSKTQLQQQNNTSLSIKSVGTENPEYDRVKREIVDIRSAIEHAEKSYKELLTIRRLMPQAIFGDQEAPFQDVSDANNGDYVGRAREELGRVRAHLQAMEEEKSIKAQNVKESLKEKISVMKEKFKKREALIQAGPKFKRHFFCNFGNVLLVSALTDFSYAVFSSQNTLEIWHVPEESQERAQLIELFDLNVDPLVNVIELFRERDENLGKGCRPTTQQQSTQSTRTANANVDMSRPQTGATDFGNPLGKAPINSLNDSASTSQASLLFYREEIETHLGVETVSSLDEQSQTKMQKRVKSPQKDTRQRYSYFLGSSTGQAIILDIRVTFDSTQKKLLYDHMITSRQKLSSQPLKLALSYALPEDNCRTIVIETTSSESTLGSPPERCLQGYSMDLTLMWSCPLDMLKQTAIDRQQRISSPFIPIVGQSMRLMVMKQMEEMNITALEYDTYHKTILVALRRGTIVRVTPLRDENEIRSLTKGNRAASMALLLSNTSGGKADSSDSLEKEGGSDPAYLVKIAWCLDLYSTNMQSTASHGKMESEFNALVQSKFSKLSVFKINAIRFFISRYNKKPQLLISSSDGMIRLYQDESLKCLTRPILFPLERDARADDFHSGDDIARVPSQIMQAEIAVLNASPEIQLALAYTSTTSLFTYDPIDPSQSTMELQVLSNRGGYQSHISQMLANFGQEASNNRSPNGPKDVAPVAGFLPDKYAYGRQILNVLDDKTGLAVLCNGREWSLFSLKDMIEYHGQETAKQT